MKTCSACGRPFGRRAGERPAAFAGRKRCGFYCRPPIKNPDKVGRDRAEVSFPIEQPCEVCGKAGKGRGVIDRHHRDSNRLNNEASNIAFLCRKHHQAAHRLTDGKVGGGPRPRVAAESRDRAAERARRARALFDVGWTTAQVATLFGYHEASVTRWLRKYPAPEEDR